MNPTPCNALGVLCRTPKVTRGNHRAAGEVTLGTGQVTSQTRPPSQRMPHVVPFHGHLGRGRPTWAVYLRTIRQRICTPPSCTHPCKQADMHACIHRVHMHAQCGGAGGRHHAAVHASIWAGLAKMLPAHIYIYIYIVP